MRTAYKHVMVGSFAALLAGCGGGSDGVVTDGQSSLSMKRVYVDAATQEQWDSILVACGDDGAMNCAVVCHVPPGNPDNRHTITVGVNAVKAHLRHTHADRKNGAIGDYLGDCNASPDDDGGGSTDDGGSTGGDTGGSTGGDTGGSTGVDTGGSTGGDTGGSTGGDTGGSTGGSTDPVVTPEPSPTPAPSPAPDSGTATGGDTSSGGTDSGTSSGDTGGDSSTPTDDGSNTGSGGDAGYVDYYEPVF